MSCGSWDIKVSSVPFIPCFISILKPFHSIYLSFLKLLLNNTYTTYPNPLYIQQSGLYIPYSHYILLFDIHTDIIPPLHALPPPDFHKNSHYFGPVCQGDHSGQKHYIGLLSTKSTWGGSALHSCGSLWASFSVDSDDSCWILPTPHKSNNGVFSPRDKSPWGTQQISAFSCTRCTWAKTVPQMHFPFPKAGQPHSAFPSAPAEWPLCQASPYWYHRHLPPSAPGRFYLHGSLVFSACFTCVMASTARANPSITNPLFQCISPNYGPYLEFFKLFHSIFFSCPVGEGSESGSVGIWLLAKVNLPQCFFSFFLASNNGHTDFNQ